MNKTSFSKRGFTLVEILMVTALVGILASVILVSLTNSKAKARDAQRVGDLETIAGAIEAYFSYNNALPRSNGWCTYISNPTSGIGAAFQSDLAPYLPRVPLDPSYANTSKDYFYGRNSNNQYTLCTMLEQSSAIKTSSYTWSGCAGWPSPAYNYCIDN